MRNQEQRLRLKRELPALDWALIWRLVSHGYTTAKELQEASDEELLALPVIGQGRLEQIRQTTGGRPLRSLEILEGNYGAEITYDPNDGTVSVQIRDEEFYELLSDTLPLGEFLDRLGIDEAAIRRVRKS